MTYSHCLASTLLLMLPLAVYGQTRAAEAVRDDPIDAQTPVLASTQPSVVRLYPPLDRIGAMAADDKEVWFGTAGGVKILDRATGKWRFFPSYDGMPRGHSGLLLTPENAYLFGGWDNKYTVLNRATGASGEVQLGDAYVRGPWGPPYSSHILHEGSLWAIYTGGRVELGPPDIIELRQFDPATGKAGLAVDIRKLLPLPATRPTAAGWAFPAGLAVAGGRLWVGLTHGIVEVNPASGAARFIELPAAADYTNNGQQIRNAVQTIASGESDLWLALQSGLGQFTVASGKFTFHHLGDAKDAPAGLFVERDAVWMGGYRGSIGRHDCKTGRLESFDTGLRGLYHLMKAGGRLWLIASDPGTWYFDLGDKKLVSIVHDPLSAYGLASLDHGLLIEQTYYIPAAREMRPGEARKREAGVLALDVLTGAVRFTPTDLTGGMQQHEGTLWLLGDGRAAALDLATGRLGEAKGPGLDGRSLSHPLRLIAERQGKRYLLAQTYKAGAADAYAMSVLTLDPAAGKLDVLLTVPEAWRQQNAKIEGITDSYLYLAYVERERVDKRYNLARGTWEDAPKRTDTGGWTRVTQALGREWWSFGREVRGYAGDDRAPQVFGFAPEHIEELSTVDGELEACTSHLILRYDGKTWRARSRDEPGLVRGTDLKGRPTDLAVVGDGRGLVIRRDRALLAPEWTPLGVGADGQLVLPPALGKLIPAP